MHEAQQIFESRQGPAIELLRLQGGLRIRAHLLAPYCTSNMLASYHTNISLLCGSNLSHNVSHTCLGIHSYSIIFPNCSGETIGNRKTHQSLVRNAFLSTLPQGRPPLCTSARPQPTSPASAIDWPSCSPK